MAERTVSAPAPAAHPETRLALYDPRTGAPTLNNPQHGSEPAIPITMVFQIFQTLEQHGFRRPEGRRAAAHATADACAAIVRLVDAFTARAPLHSALGADREEQS